jgi:hypothetical protein
MKTLLILLTVGLVVFSFAAVLFHHHDGDHEHDCPVCRLIQAITGLFVLAFAALIAAVVKVQKWLTVFKARFTSITLVSSLKDRAPPASSF